jgi:phasin family protein
MPNEMFETMSGLSEATLDNCRKMGEANLKISEKLMKEQAELTSSLFEAAKSRADKVAGAKDYQTLAASQAELMQECSQLVWESCKNCAEIMTDASKAYNQLFESCVKAANANVGAAHAGGRGKSRKSA